MHQIINDIALCIIAAWALGVLAQFFRQPVILAYLLGGFAIGPSGFGLVHEQESVATISELGLIFLLFMIGLEIDLKKIISAGTSILVTGASQILGGAVAGVAFFYLMGFPLTGGRWDALYLGIAASLSSTVIIVKVLYDKRELDTLPGRVTLGLLVLQDLLVILFLAVQPSLDNLRAGALLLSFVRAGVLVATALTVSRFLLPPLFRSVARLPELVLVGALAWCFLVGDLAARLQLSREMGALIAGVSLSTFPYALDVTAKVTSLRDFFVTLFFVGLGMTHPRPEWNSPWMGLVVRHIYSGEPPADNIRAALFAQARAARKLASGHQSQPDQRVFSCRAGAWARGKPYRSGEQGVGFFCVRAPGDFEHIRDDEFRLADKGRDFECEALWTSRP